MRLRIRILATAMAALLGFGLAVTGPGVLPAMASQIKLVVNDVPITNYDISRRAALLRLQRKRGNISAMARQDMIDAALERSEMKRYNITVSDAEVNGAFAKFAAGNHMTTAQLSQVLNQAGVTADHFKEYIRTQLGWNRVLQKRFQVVNTVSDQEAAQRIQKDGGVKPKTTEYTLQQVIFVIPSDQKRQLLAKRRREAEALRKQFTNCDATRQLVLSKKLIDVTVRDLGRFLEPQLPTDWSKLIKATSVDHTTTVRETDRGLEFVAVCNAQEVSDDRVAQLVFSTESASVDKKVQTMRDSYIKELRQKAHIEQR